MQNKELIDLLKEHCAEFDEQQEKLSKIKSIIYDLTYRLSTINNKDHVKEVEAYKVAIEGISKIY